MNLIQKTLLTVSVMGGVLAAQTAFADLLTIDNPSFETDQQTVSPYYSFGAAGDTSVSGWAIGGLGRAGVQNASQFPGLVGPVPDGNQFGYINNAAGGITTLSQTLSSDWLPNISYTLSLFVGGRTDGNNPGTGYSVSLYGGSTLLGSATPIVPPTGSWSSVSLNYTSPSSVTPDSPLEIVMEMPADSGFAQLDFDEVTMGAVPVISEPGILQIAGVCMLTALGVPTVRSLRKLVRPRKKSKTGKSA
jgi:hypothetical protein